MIDARPYERNNFAYMSPARSKRLTPADARNARGFGLGEMEQEASKVLRLLVRQTARGENRDADLVKQAKAAVEGYKRRAWRETEQSKQSGAG